MKKFFKIFLGIVFLILLVLTFVYLWSKGRPEKVVYTTVNPTIDTIRQYVIATGKIEPRDEVLIKPQISGIISDIRCEAGDRVNVGDVIATVKVIPELGSLNSAESRVTVARLSLEQQRKEFNRTEALYQKGVVSQEEYEQGQTNMSKAEEEMQNAQDALEIVRNGIAQRYADVSNTQIRSTITGMILDVPVKVGNSVIQANTFNDGTTIASVADMGDMLFRGKVDETDVGKLKMGMPVVLTIGAMQGTVLDAELEYISPKAVEENGVIMFEVKAAARIPDSTFVRAGYSANASIVIQSREGVMVLPENTLQFEEGQPYVYVLTSPEGSDEQTFERRKVEVGLSDGINIEILSGVNEKEKVRSLQVQNI